MIGSTYQLLHEFGIYIYAQLTARGWITPGNGMSIGFKYIYNMDVTKSRCSLDFLFGIRQFPTPKLRSVSMQSKVLG